MNNINLNLGESVKLIKGVEYIVIDALYFNEIKNYQNVLDLANWKQIIKAKAFPYLDTPFALYSSSRDLFSISLIKEVEYSEALSMDSAAFSSDTGLILIIAEKYLKNFSQEYEYGILTESTTGLINTEFWQTMIKKSQFGNLALVYSEGIDQHADLKGSGIYRILEE